MSRGPRWVVRYQFDGGPVESPTTFTRWVAAGERNAADEQKQARRFTCLDAAKDRAASVRACGYKNVTVLRLTPKAKPTDGALGGRPTDHCDMCVGPMPERGAVLMCRYCFNHLPGGKAAADVRADVIQAIRRDAIAECVEAVREWTSRSCMCECPHQIANALALLAEVKP